MNNTLYMALWSQAQTSALLGTLQTATGPLRVMGDSDSDALTLLVRCLADAKPLRAKRLVVYTNDATLLDLYTPPIRLEPTGPGREHLVVLKQWQVLYHTCNYRSWRLIHAESLPDTQKYWRELYGNRNTQAA